ncbi:Uncharacterised protein [Lysinibacillus sphaericus]|nr:Uncharacterised protein [Lysinibacillus sphaericus]
MRNGTQTRESGTKSIQSDTKSNRSGTNKKKSDRLSDWELAELMGTKRDTYTRRRGAVRKR